MKNMVFFAFAASLAALFFSCASAPGPSPSQGSTSAAPPPEAPAAPVLPYTRVDYQGASLGREVPRWVDFASDRDKVNLSKIHVLSGFILDRDFWQRLKYKDDGREEIDYYAVYVIGKEDLRAQIDIALGKIEAKTQAEREAKEAIHQAIRETSSLLD
jgi:hypothetical protein